ncbi:MAG: PEP/pyruvate-binding domain-containing protein [Myxococcota bacterium]|nr:PEP/pyruvate-binding domain-containing protein [Myxococcota bacterium]
MNDSSNTLIVPLEYLSEDQTSVMGAKGRGLKTLQSHGLHIPTTFVLTTKALHDFLQHHSLWQEQASAKQFTEIYRAFPDLSLPIKTIRSLESIAGQLGYPLVVRSSAVDEDGATQSFAGQYETRLNIQSQRELIQAVLDCWMRYFAPDIQTYRQSVPRLDGMALLIQPQVESAYAGVLFTINPLNGSWREMSIETVCGQGEKLVSSQVVPNFYLFKRPRSHRRFWGRLAARVQVQLLEEQQHGSGPSLEMLRVLCRKGLMLERHLGVPQDIEWAMDATGKLVFLQTRSITTLASEKEKEDIIWTRQFLGERWMIPSTQLGWSEMGSLISYFIEYPKTSADYLGGGSAVRLHDFSPYINATIFRKLVFKLPGAEPIPGFFLEMLPEDEQKNWRLRHACAPSFRVYASIFQTTFQEKRWQRFRWNPFLNWRHWDDYLKRLDVFLKQNQTPLVTKSQAVKRVEQSYEMAREYTKVHICSLIFANLWHQIASWRLKEGGYEKVLPVVLRAYRTTATQRSNRALWLLGKDQISEDEFLHEFGHRSGNSWALFAPRWCEDLEQLHVLAGIAAGGSDPQNEERIRLRATNEQTKALPKNLRYIVRLTQRYLFLREEQRFHFERLLWSWKQAWLWLEKESGIALRHLTKEEILLLWDGDLKNAKALSLEREANWQSAYKRWAEGEKPPKLLVGDQPQYHNIGGSLQGLGISSGVARGLARVIQDASEIGALQEGEILIVSSAEPGWTPLFLRAGGLIMELGGMLSHGAVIAREYKLPAVAGVFRATDQIHTGDEIALDGSRGKVWVLKKS